MKIILQVNAVQLKHNENLKNWFNLPCVFAHSMAFIWEQIVRSIDMRSLISAAGSASPVKFKILFTLQN